MFLTVVTFCYRKTCNSCKCPREDHEVYHDEWVNVQERLGFKASQDAEKRNSKDRCVLEGYTWVPPGLSSRKVCIIIILFFFYNSDTNIPCLK